MIHKLSLVGWEEETSVLFEAGEMDADGWREYVQSVTSQVIDHLIVKGTNAVCGDDIFRLSEEIISKRFPVVAPASNVSIRWDTPDYYNQRDEIDTSYEAISAKDQQKQIDFNKAEAKKITDEDEASGFTWH